MIQNQRYHGTHQLSQCLCSSNVKSFYLSSLNLQIYYLGIHNSQNMDHFISYLYNKILVINNENDILSVSKKCIRWKKIILGRTRKTLWHIWHAFRFLRKLIRKFMRVWDEIVVTRDWEGKMHLVKKQILRN